MPPAVATPAKILEQLNNDTETRDKGPWIASDGYQALTTVIPGPQIQFNPANGVVIKSFVSTRTGEIKLFLVKLLDVPERQYLA